MLEEFYYPRETTVGRLTREGLASYSYVFDASPPDREISKTRALPFLSVFYWHFCSTDRYPFLSGPGPWRRLKLTSPSFPCLSAFWRSTARCPFPSGLSEALRGLCLSLLLHLCILPLLLHHHRPRLPILLFHQIRGDLSNSHDHRHPFLLA